MFCSSVIKLYWQSTVELVLLKKSFLFSKAKVSIFKAALYEEENFADTSHQPDQNNEGWRIKSCQSGWCQCSNCLPLLTANCLCCRSFHYLRQVPRCVMGQIFLLECGCGWKSNVLFVNRINDYSHNNLLLIVVYEAPNVTLPCVHIGPPLCAHQHDCDQRWLHKRGKTFAIIIIIITIIIILYSWYNKVFQYWADANVASCDWPVTDSSAPSYLKTWYCVGHTQVHTQDRGE